LFLQHILTKEIIQVLWL